MKGIQILGISTDTVQENAAFAAKYHLPFPLLSDTERKVCTAYGVCANDRADRATFMIGADGKIQQVYEDIKDYSGHADTILDAVTPSAFIELAVIPQGQSPTQDDSVSPLVYALGTIGYDFGTEARQDSFAQAGLTNPNDPNDLLAYLDAAPYDAARVTWTLNIDATPVYAIHPAGAFAETAYQTVRGFLNAQLNEGVERVSIPGYVTSSTQLISGQTVPLIVPTLRGMYSWSTPALVQAVLGEQTEGDEAQSDRAANAHNFLERVYYELRNLGTTPQERAINFAATNAFQIAQVFEEAIQHELQLDNIDVEKSPIARLGADAWDVKLTFFDPENRDRRARRVYRFTVDVSDVIPVTVGQIRSFNLY